jgi:hypothetical protein
MIAEVIEVMGKHRLRVGGICLATEGDRCRDGTLACVSWDERSLRDAAALINRHNAETRGPRAPLAGPDAATSPPGPSGPREVNP